MPKELYFDISSEESGGSLYRISEGNGEVHFHFHYSTYDSDKDEVQVFDTVYIDFGAFWKVLTKDPRWFYLHPLFVHPEQREFVRDRLKAVDWNVHPNKKWQESHQ